MNKLEGKETLKCDYEFFYGREGTTVQVRQVLKAIEILKETGRAECLILAFRWRSTPQGYNYWDRLYLGNVEPTEEDYAYLHWLAETYG